MYLGWQATAFRSYTLLPFSAYKRSQEMLFPRRQKTSSSTAVRYSNLADYVS
jgi:hypothetical protein